MITAFIIFAAAAFFSVDGTMEENGWTLGRSQPEDKFSVKGGVLTCQCSPNPMKGVSYHRPIEFPEVGEMTYEVKLFVAGHTDRYVLQVCLGEFMMSFVGRSMIRHYPVPGLTYPNWTNVGKDRIPGDAWTKVRLRWNTPKKTIKYYVGEDQTVPSYVESDVVIKPGGKGGYRLTLGNYGLHNDYETHQIRNIEIRAVDEAAEAAKVKRDTAIVFAGLCSEFFPVESWTKGFPADKIVTFTLEYNGLNYSTSNKLSLSGYPDDELCARAKLFVLCDMPLEKRVISYAAQENILEAVRNGARMIVTGGLAGLEKCGDFDAPIAKALPVALENQWNLPSGGKKAVCDYGKGKIVVLNERKMDNASDERK